MNRQDVSNISLPKKKQQSYRFEHEDFAAGIPPYLRGAESTMYIRKPWSIINSLYFSTIEEGNVIFRDLINHNKKETLLVLDLTILKFTIISIDDMKILFNQISLTKTSLLIIGENNEAVKLLELYIALAEEQEINKELLSITIYNTITNSNTNDPKKTIETLKKTSKEIPKFNYKIIIDAYIEEKNHSAETELAHALNIGAIYIKKALKSGLNIDDIAPNLYFTFIIKNHHFSEIAKMRAGRMLWSKIITQFKPKKPESSILRIYAKTNSYNSNYNLQETYSLITTKNLSAVFGGTQSIYNNTIKDYKTSTTAISQFLHNEILITKTIDPWAGSHHLEQLTENITKTSWNLIDEKFKTNTPNFNTSILALLKKPKKNQ